MLLLDLFTFTMVIATCRCLMHANALVTSLIIIAFSPLYSLSRKYSEMEEQQVQPEISQSSDTATYLSCNSSQQHDTVAC